MSWTWDWNTFLITLPILVVLVAVARVLTNEAVIGDVGFAADYKTALVTRPIALAVGTVLAGAIYAVGVTVIAGFV